MTEIKNQNIRCPMCKHEFESPQVIYISNMLKVFEDIEKAIYNLQQIKIELERVTLVVDYKKKVSK